jgi:hypothetical protein
MGPASAAARHRPEASRLCRSQLWRDSRRCPGGRGATHRGLGAQRGVAVGGAHIQENGSSYWQERRRNIARSATGQACEAREVPDARAPCAAHRRVPPSARGSSDAGQSWQSHDGRLMEPGFITNDEPTNREAALVRDDESWFTSIVGHFENTSGRDGFLRP